MTSKPASLLRNRLRPDIPRPRPIPPIGACITNRRVLSEVFRAMIDDDARHPTEHLLVLVDGRVTVLSLDAFLALIPDDQREQWRWVSGYRGRYAASSWGRIWNVKTGRVLKPSTTWKRYLQVELKTHQLRKKSRLVHRLIAGAFHGKRPDGLVTNHIDHDRWNACAWNLEYVTNSANVLHGIEHRKQRKAA